MKLPNFFSIKIDYIKFEIMKDALSRYVYCEVQGFLYYMATTWDDETSPCILYETDHMLSFLFLVKNESYVSLYI